MDLPEMKATLKAITTVRNKKTAGQFPADDCMAENEDVPRWLLSGTSTCCREGGFR